MIRQGFQGQRADLMVITESISTLTTKHPIERRPAITAGSFEEQVSPNAENVIT